MSPPPPRSWIYFFSTDAFLRNGARHISKASKTTKYRIDSSVIQRGRAVVDFKPGDEILRMCSNEPFGDCDGVPAGCTQHLHYTSAAQRDKLVAISAKEIDPAEQPITVLIPIRKSDAWWSMAQDARAAYLNGTTTSRGHTAIGEDYAPRIFRQLLHSRYLDSSKKPYDFLTYFEFPEKNREGFKSLLASLRDETLNPEWAFVEMEQEIWMRKLKC